MLITASKVNENPNVKAQTLPKVRARLEQAIREYELGFATSRDDAWAQVQVLVLALVLGRQLDDAWHKAWNLSLLLSESDLSRDDPLRRFWALGNLLELHLLATAPGAHAPGDDHRARAVESAEWLKQSYTPKYVIELKSTRRQLERYIRFFPLVNAQLSALSPLAQELLNVLPQPEPTDLG